ncbi:MAG: hypothetical protein P8N25_01110 [Alphaproteobacteria bacterium]|nr:hypothetical protein [Alphaproteobacteria bacterium]
MFNFDNVYIEYGLIAFIVFWVIPYIMAIPISILSIKKSPYQKWLLALSLILSPLITGLIYLWVKKLNQYFKKKS